MDNQTVVIELSKKLIDHCTGLYKDLEVYIEGIDNIVLPSYEELVDPQYFFEEYSKFTTNSDKNHVFKVKCSKVIIDISSLLFELNKHNFSSVLKKYIDTLKFHKDKCSAYVKVLDSYQRDLTDVLNYFSSIHYALTTPYRD